MSSWSKKFIDAFNTHEVAPMVDLCAPNVKWEDVSGHIDYDGLDGVKNMIELTLMAIPDCRCAHHGGIEHGNQYSVEWTIAGTIFGREFACRGASVGEFDDEGRIVHNRDYWDSRSFPEMPAGPENPDLAELQAEHS